MTGGHEDAIIGFVEYGTIDQPANPFIRKSFANKKDAVIRLVIERVKQGFDKAVEGGSGTTDGQ